MTELNGMQGYGGYLSPGMVTMSLAEYDARQAEQQQIISAMRLRKRYDGAIEVEFDVKALATLIKQLFKQSVWADTHTFEDLSDAYNITTLIAKKIPEETDEL